MRSFSDGPTSDNGCDTPRWTFPLTMVQMCGSEWYNNESAKRERKRHKERVQVDFHFCAEITTTMIVAEEKGGRERESNVI